MKYVIFKNQSTTTKIESLPRFEEVLFLFVFDDKGKALNEFYPHSLIFVQLLLSLQMLQRLMISIDDELLVE